MPEFIPPLLEEIRKEDFLRVKDTLYSSQNGWPFTGHSGLANEARLPSDQDQFTAMIEGDPDSYDAGQYISSEGKLSVSGYSDSLQLPRTIEARNCSGVLFQRLCPQHTIETHQDPAIL